MLLLLCNDVVLTEEKMNGELWACRAVLHWADNGSFNVLFLILGIISCSFLAFLPPFFFDKFYMQVCVCPTCIHLISLFDATCLYLHNGQLIQVQRWLGQRDKSHLYSNLGRVHWSKIPVSWETVVFHAILFLGLTEIFFGSGLDYSLFCVLLIGQNGMFESKVWKQKETPKSSKFKCCNVQHYKFSFRMARVIFMERKTRFFFFFPPH